MILLINICKEKLHELEFVKPIENILNKNKIEFQTKHYKKISKDDLNADKIVICGTSLKDKEYLEDIDNLLLGRGKFYITYDCYVEADGTTKRCYVVDNTGNNCLIEIRPAEDVAEDLVSATVGKEDIIFNIKIVEEESGKAVRSYRRRVPPEKDVPDTAKPFTPEQYRYSPPTNTRSST